MPALIEGPLSVCIPKYNSILSFVLQYFLYRKANNSPDKAAKPATYLPASTAPIAPEVVLAVADAAAEVVLAALVEEEVTEAVVVVFAALVLEETTEVVTVVVLLAGLLV
jgi:hypothetical protein